MRSTARALGAATALWTAFAALAAAPDSLHSPNQAARPTVALSPDTPDFAGEPASADARYTAQWVMATHDNQGLPFAIVDKKAAKLFVFAPGGRVIGATSALLGLTPGDQSAPGVGQRVPSGLSTADRTTPAGRFVSEPGHNLKGEDVVWVDYEAAFAIHRLRPANAKERRPQRLASASSADNRISLGCVVVPVAFYESVVSPTLGKGRAVVYVLPETTPVQAMFGEQALGVAQAR